MRRLGGLLLVLAFVAAACTAGSEVGDDDTDLTSVTSTVAGATTAAPPTTLLPSTTTEPPFLKPYGGEIRFNRLMPETLNPYLVTEAREPSIVEVMGNAYLGGVWRINGDTGQVVPDLVTELPSLTNGGLTINGDGSVTVKYEIDPAAVWSDGVSVTGDDFAFTYEIVVDSIRRVAAAGPDAVFTTTCDQDLELEIYGATAYSSIDPGSLVVSPKSFEYTLTDGGAYSSDLFRWIVPKHRVEGTDFLRDWNRRMWVSAGPFVPQGEIADGAISMIRNDNYWRVDPETGQELPYLDSLEITGFSDEYAALLSPAFQEVLANIFDCGVDAMLEELGLSFANPQDAAFLGEAFQDFDRATEQLYFDGVILDLPLAVTDERVPDLEARGVEFRIVESGGWEHLTFHFGDARLRANPGSLVEHVEFRKAVAHAIDRDRIAQEANGVEVDAIGSLVEAFTPQPFGEGWDVYEYDPAKARVLLADLCSRLGRDCVAEPPTVVFTTDPTRGDRQVIAGLLAEMLAEVGIGFEQVDQRLFQMLDFEGCDGWEMSTWTWGAEDGFAPLVEMLDVFDPQADPQARNYYQWGTGARSGQEDDPKTECDESEVLNYGPSAVIDEFTARFDELSREAEEVIDPAEYRPILEEMEQILVDQVVMIPLYLRPVAQAHREDILGGYGFKRQFSTEWFLWNVDRWYRADLVDG